VDINSILVEFLRSLDFSTAGFVLTTFLLIYAAVLSQRREDFDFADMLKSKGKPSAARLGVIVSLVVSTTILLQYSRYAIQNPSDMRLSTLVDLLLIYLSVWSGTKVLEKGIDAWASRTQQQGNTNFNTPTSIKTQDFQDTEPMNYKGN
jgi:hypothetical protein